MVKNVEMMVKPKTGGQHFLFASGRALHAQDGSKIGAVIAMKDVTDLKDSERRLEASERLLRTIADTLPVLIAYVDKDCRYQFANATYEKWFGIAAADLIGKTVEEAFGRTFYQEAKTALQRALAGQLTRFEWQTSKQFGARYIELIGIPDTKHGVTEGAYVLTSDITAIKRHAEELSRLARSDTLTGLPNRRSYEERLEEALQRSKRTGRGLALMFLDIDHFKQINDTLGHAGGDAVLQEFSRRLKASVRTTDIVSRLAGDEFTVVLEGLENAKEAALVAGKIISAFAEPVQLDRGTWAVSTSIGVTFVKGDDIDPQTLNRQADTALYRAKDNGRGQCLLLSSRGGANGVPPALSHPAPRGARPRCQGAQRPGRKLHVLSEPWAGSPKLAFEQVTGPVNTLVTFSVSVP
ncbi:diguanylate cyclase domain-containing protein [Massilia phosphatilytica]